MGLSGSGLFAREVAPPAEGGVGGSGLLPLVCRGADVGGDKQNELELRAQSRRVCCSGTSPSRGGG
eukprot:11170452-Lingulodinium_polyedra.AAC.1